MVERVLQYAGIESGLGFGNACGAAAVGDHRGRDRQARCRCSTIRLQVHREVAPDLPQVIGDAAALRSVVQNLIANAVKYGGRDRWVGIRAEHAVDRRHLGGAHHRQRSRRRHSGVGAAAHLRSVLPRLRRRGAPGSRQRSGSLAGAAHRYRTWRPGERTTAPVPAARSPIALPPRLPRCAAAARRGQRAAGDARSDIRRRPLPLVTLTA